MTRDALTGSRIRERRVQLSIKQAELARLAEISPSYLNLIEHNRRRIGGKLLLDIASILNVEPALLSEGAEAALIGALREASAREANCPAELERVEEFAGRFPGWAELVSLQSRRLAAMEQTIVSMSERMTHDPHLSKSMHDILGAVTAIRSTASILVETNEIEPEWRERFYRNINEEAQRLAESSRGLAGYLDDDRDKDERLTTPQDEIERFFEHHSYHFDMLETASDADDAIQGLVEAESSSLISKSAKAQVRLILQRYCQDAALMPLKTLAPLLKAGFPSPAVIADHFGVDLGSAMRRLALLPEDITGGPVGLAMCDSSGTLIMRKPIDHFALPRFGAACPLWGLYQALSRPMAPLRQYVQQEGRDAATFLTYSIAQPVGGLGFEHLPLFEAHMLFIPVPRDETSGHLVSIGTSCRVCARIECAGRREPPILSEGI